jgi:hypothetical protein
MSSPKINKKLLVHAEIFENLTLSLGGGGGGGGGLGGWSTIPSLKVVIPYPKVSFIIK